MIYTLEYLSLGVPIQGPVLLHRHLVVGQDVLLQSGEEDFFVALAAEYLDVVLGVVTEHQSPCSPLVCIVLFTIVLFSLGTKRLVMF